MKKMLFIMNPVSGMRRAAKYLPDILTMYTQAGYDVITHLTSGRGDATEVAARLGGEVDLVVCCGGDGTFNETVSGLMRADCKTPIGYIPSGSTNDFATSLKLSTNILQAAQDVLYGDPVPYDLGRFGNRYFSYVASFGAFTKSSYATPQTIKNALGHTAYVLSSISELSQIRMEHIRMEMDDCVVEDDFIFGAICNSTSVGGVIMLDPSQVNMSDGLFEVLLIRAPRSLSEISQCIQALQNQTYNCSMITFRSARRVTVYADANMPWTLDGEREDGHATVEAEAIHHAFRLIKRTQP